MLKTFAGQVFRGCPKTSLRLNSQYPSVRTSLVLSAGPSPVVTSIRYESSSRDPSIHGYLSDCAPTELARSVLLQVHDYTGMSWVATVLSATVLIRTTLTLPLSVYQNYVVAKIENISLLEVPEIDRKVQKEAAMKKSEHQWTDKQTTLYYRRRMKQEWDRMIIRDNCHPFKSTVTLWVQVPLWVFLTSALRNLCTMHPPDPAAQIAYLELSVGGFLWIPNLTVADGSLILPVMMGLINLLIVEIQVLRRIRKPTRLQNFITNFLRFFSIGMIPIAASVPSLVTVYWTASSMFGLGQNLLLMSNSVRTVCRIPDTPMTLDRPYLHLYENIMDRGSRLSGLFKKNGKN